MSNQIQFLDFSFKNSPVRVITDPTNEYWFCGTDVCDILGYANAPDALKKHCKQAGIAKRYISYPSGKKEVIFINEPNLYRLIIKSRKPEAEPFEAWVMEEVLPTIRKTGRYQVGEQLALPQKILNREIPAPDVLVGGTPCQAFSVAGARQSLDDERGNLTLVLIHILEAIDYVRFNDGQPPCVLLWENVPGVLSTKDNAFGHLLAGLAQESEPLQPTGRKWTNAGYVHSARTIAWRVLNAQHFGVAQRRKRVFLVASARKRSVSQILIECASMQRDFEPRTETQQNSTAYAESSFGTYRPTTIGATLKRCGGALDGGSETLIVHGTQDPICSDKTAHCLGRNNGMENVLFEVKGAEAIRVTENEVSPTLKARMGTGGNNVPCIAIAGNIINRADNAGGNGVGADESGVMYTLTRTDVHAVAHQTIVRKLTPIECERLQGFPDNYTRIPYRNKPPEQCPDSPRYKAIGNSMCVPNMRWIGKRLNNYLTHSPR